MTTDIMIYKPQVDLEVAVEAAKFRKAVISRLMADKVLVDGVHFGTIPGTTKATLYKPGAEMLCSALALAPAFEPMKEIEDYTAGFFSYRYKCVLSDILSGAHIGEGIGSCNSKESKYRWRNQNRACPVCGKETIIKGREEFGGGWVCHKKQGGCGAKFADDDPTILGQAVGKVENPDIFDQVNTIDKMAQKRALVAAILIAANASEFFTQDLEDIVITDAPVETPAPPPKARKRKVDNSTGEITREPVEGEEQKTMLMSVENGLTEKGKPMHVLTTVKGNELYLFGRDAFRTAGWPVVDEKPYLFGEEGDITTFQPPVVAYTLKKGDFHNLTRIDPDWIGTGEFVLKTVPEQEDIPF
jgi:hypothetical protein